MPIQSVFASQAPAEAPAARSRANDARGGESGAVFALPETGAPARETVPADKAADPAAAERQPEAATAQEAEADTGGIAVLIAMAAAPKAAKTGSADDRGDAEEESAGAVPKKAGAAETACVAAAVQVLPALPPQAAPIGGDAAAGETGDATAAGSGSKTARDARPAVAAAAMGMAPAEATAGEQPQTGAAPAGEGKAGQGVLPAAGLPVPETPGKAGQAGEAKGARPAAEARAPDAQPQPAPFDLSSLLQQASATAGPERLAQAFDPGPPPGAAGQGAAGGQPTPVHVVPIEIGLRAMAGSRQFDIRLDPDELGRVDVNLSISDRGEVSAKLVVDRVETLHLLQRDARTLERAFEQAGLKPSDGGVDISLRDPSGQSPFRQHRQHDEAPERRRAAGGGEPAEDVSLSIDPVPQRRLIRLGGVDLSI